MEWIREPMEVNMTKSVSSVSYTHLDVYKRQIGDNTLIGMGATVMNGSVIGKNCLIAAGSLVLEHQNIPDGSMVMRCV